MRPRVVVATASALVALTGLVGLAHLPVARPILLALSGGACPVGAPLSSAAAEQARETTLAPLRGELPATTRPALGFDLDLSTVDQATAWATAAGARCADAHGVLHCAPFTHGAAGMAPADSVDFQWAADGRLLAVSLQRELPAGDAILAVDAGGTGAITRGKADAAWLAGGALNQYMRTSTASDYRAQLSATNLGHGRIVEREVYQSLRPATLARE